MEYFGQVGLILLMGNGVSAIGTSVFEDTCIDSFAFISIFERQKGRKVLKLHKTWDGKSKFFSMC
jgi:hypothetical protein